MSKTLFVNLILFAAIFSSCKKDDSDSPPPPIPADSLGTGWSRINTASIGTESFLDIFFIDNNNGFVVNGDKIFKSLNGGSTWSHIKTVGSSIINISVANTNNALFVSRENKMYVTTDGGLSIDSITLDDNKLSDVFYVNENIAYAIGDKLWKSINGGKAWDKVYEFGSSGNREYRTLYFVSELIGWAAANEGLYKTENGGSFWTKVSMLKPYAVFFVNNNIGYLSASSSEPQKTTDGITWNSIPALSADTTGDIHFITESLGFIAAGGNRILKTSNGSSSWEQVAKIGDPTDRIIELHFTDENHGWACTSKGILRYTK